LNSFTKFVLFPSHMPCNICNINLKTSFKTLGWMRKGSLCFFYSRTLKALFSLTQHDCESSPYKFLIMDS